MKQQLRITLISNNRLTKEELHGVVKTSYSALFFIYILRFHMFVAVIIVYNLPFGV